MLPCVCTLHIPGLNSYCLDYLHFCELYWIDQTQYCDTIHIFIWLC